MKLYEVRKSYSNKTNNDDTDKNKTDLSFLLESELKKTFCKNGT